jgi:CMP-N,N'-diacetyllegionaminic acid synthase
MPNLAIIPARGGSKGVPGKNLREVAGRPLLAWSIVRALEAEAIDTVLVSTDDAEIAEVARAHGAEVPFLRPAELATDEAPTEPVMAHALDWYAERGASFDSIALLQPTSPLRLAGTIDAAFAEFARAEADSLVGVVASHHFFWRRDGAVEALYDFRNRPRRQDLAPGQRWYRETGSIYISRTDAFRRSGNRLSGSIALFVMDELEGWEIDSEADFAVMDALFTRIANADRS